jgi:TPR repeat protein
MDYLRKSTIALGLIMMMSGSVYASDAADKAYDSGNYKEAFQLYMQEVDKQDATAQHRLGWMYDNGKGVTQDYSKAAHYYTLAANQGFDAAQKNLG